MPKRKAYCPRLHRMRQLLRGKSVGRVDQSADWLLWVKPCAAWVEQMRENKAHSSACLRAVWGIGQKTSQYGEHVLRCMSAESLGRRGMNPSWQWLRRPLRCFLYLVPLTYEGVGVTYVWSHQQAVYSPINCNRAPYRVDTAYITKKLYEPTTSAETSKAFETDFFLHERSAQAFLLYVPRVIYDCFE